MSVLQYIQKLLFRYDCVIIPGFGGFITHRIPADIHPITHKFLPPYKKIGFNERLKLNDGLLITYIAHEEGISRDEADKMVKDFAEQIRQGLRRRNVYELKEVGRFFYNTEDLLEFEPEVKVNYLDDSFGLAELFFKPIERDIKFKTMNNETNQGMRPPVKKGNSLKSDENGNPVEKKSSALKVVLIILPLLVLAGAGIFVFTQNDGALGSFDPFSWFSSKEASAPVVELEPEYEPVHTNPVAEEPAVDVSEGAAITDRQGRYFVVIGAFRERDNAFNLRSKMAGQGVDLTIIAPSGASNLYKVSIADFDTQRSAVKRMEEMREEYGNTIWVMRY